MFGKIVLVLVSALALSCSQPRYLNGAEVEGTNPNNGGQQQKPDPLCPLKFKESQFCVEWEFDILPTATKPGVLNFVTKRLNTVTGELMYADPQYPVSVVLFMPSMGHGAPPTTTQHLEVGTFQTTKMNFIMPGPWEILIQLKDGTAIKDEVVIRITL